MYDHFCFKQTNKQSKIDMFYYVSANRKYIEINKTWLISIAYKYFNINNRDMTFPYHYIPTRRSPDCYNKYSKYSNILNYKHITGLVHSTIQ